MSENEDCREQYVLLLLRDPQSTLNKQGQACITVKMSERDEPQLSPHVAYFCDARSTRVCVTATTIHKFSTVNTVFVYIVERWSLFMIGA